MMLSQADNVVEKFSYAEGFDAESLRNKVFYGNALKEIKNIPDNFVDCIITSPPYYFVRNYGANSNTIWDEKDEYCSHEWDDMSFCVKCGAWYGQLGLEPDVDMYINHLADIFDECFRVLKPTGNLFINIGDSYLTGGLKDFFSLGKYSYINNKSILLDADEHPMSWMQSKPNVLNFLKKKKRWVKEKQLLLIPYRLAIQLQLRGWIIRDMIIWAKKILDIKDWKQMGNGMPESTTDRLTKSYEVVIHAVKSQKYYFKKPKTKQSISSVKGVFKEFTLQGKINEGKCHEHMVSNLYCIVKSRIPSSRINMKDNVEKSDFYLSLFDEIVQNVINLLNERLQQAGLTIKELATVTGVDEEVLMHYFTTNFSDAAIPSKDFWDILQPILGLPNYQDVVKDEYKDVVPILSPYAYAGNVILCNTEGFRDHHFAVMPTKLVDFLIDIGCPEVVCKVCGKPVEKIHKVCECGSSNFVSAIVLDPFLGSGTVALVSEKKRRSWIGIEINEKYKDVIENRVRYCQKELF